MAGDWLKMEASTPDKPEVLAITARMGWDDPDLTVGKLFRVWRWFDQHTTDGNARGVTSALLDRVAGVTGFATSMQSVGWLDISDDGLSLPNFDRHCGKTAKERAQTAKRVASHKGNAKANAKGNAATVTKTVSSALPREEKRREEIKDLKDFPEKFGADSKTDPKPDLDTNPEPDLETLFDAFWSAGMRKVERKTARAAFGRIVQRKPDKTEFVVGLVADIRDRIQRGQFGFDQMHPTTYLNGERWNDEQANLNGEHHAGSTRTDRKPSDEIDWNSSFVDDELRAEAERVRQRVGR